MPAKGYKHSIETRKKIGESALRFPLSDLIAKTKNYLAQFQTGDGVPNHAGLISFLGCSRALFYKKINQSEELSSLLDLMDNIREDKLIQGGLTKKYDSGFSQFLLKTKHGYSDAPTSLTQNNFTVPADLLSDVLKTIKK